jgi:hypothetical protein
LIFRLPWYFTFSACCCEISDKQNVIGRQRERERERGVDQIEGPNPITIITTITTINIFYDIQDTRKIITTKKKCEKRDKKH